MAYVVLAYPASVRAENRITRDLGLPIADRTLLMAVKLSHLAGVGHHGIREDRIEQTQTTCATRDVAYVHENGRVLPSAASRDLQSFLTRKREVVHARCIDPRSATDD